MLLSEDLPSSPQPGMLLQSNDGERNLIISGDRCVSSAAKNAEMGITRTYPIQGFCFAAQLCQAAGTQAAV